MDLLRSWLFGREAPDRFSSKLPTLDEVTSPVTSEASGRNTLSGNQPTTHSGDLYTDATKTSKFERLILKVVPLEPGDCLGCKLVGTTVLIASGVIVLTSAIAGSKRNPSIAGRKLTTYYAVCGSLFIGFEAAAACRFFDVGPFGYLARLETKGSRR